MGIRVKGQSFVGFERTLVELKGPTVMAELMPLLPSELALKLRNREILSIGWYPMEWYGALHQAAQALHGVSISREIGRRATRHDVTHLYRFILRFLSPNTLMGQLKRLHSLIAEGGEVEVEENREGVARVRFSQCEGCNHGTWEDMLGSFETLIELCGGQEAKATVTSGGNDGDDSMTCVLSWR